MATTLGRLIETDEFEVGDMICNKENWEDGNPVFWKASEEDVAISSNEDIAFLKLVKEEEASNEV